MKQAAENPLKTAETLGLPLRYSMGDQASDKQDDELLRDIFRYWRELRDARLWIVAVLSAIVSVVGMIITLLVAL